MESNINRYDDIINLPNHRSKTHPALSMQARAAQFSPFACLTGHDEAIEETARFTDDMLELDENEMAKLDESLSFIRANIVSNPTVRIVYFKPDERKEGGAYIDYTGAIKKIDEMNKTFVFVDKSEVRLNMILSIEIKSPSTAGAEGGLV